VLHSIKSLKLRFSTKTSKTENVLKKEQMEKHGEEGGKQDKDIL
jgi:hypothetical protein